MAGFTYKSYSFVDKDPIIDQVRTIVQGTTMTRKEIAEMSGVTAHTIRNWLDGDTKKPQAATLNAVLRALGYKLSIAPIQVAETIPPTINSVSVRHVINMAKYKRVRK